jgi:hypothetical protein
LVADARTSYVEALLERIEAAIKVHGLHGPRGLRERFFHGSTRLYCAAVSDIASINFSEARPMISILAVSPASSRIMLVALIRSSSATT